MHAEVIIIHHSRHWHWLKNFKEHLINLFAAILLEYFLPKGKMSRHGLSLMVASKESDHLWIVKFQSEQKDKNFDGEDTSVHIVA